MLILPGSGATSPARSASLIIFGPKADNREVEPPSSTSIPRTHAPAEIRRAIRDVANIYADSPALEKAGLSAQEWAALFQSNIEIESAYNPQARSSVGAYGLGQLMPETAEDLGVDRFNMIENLDGSARYLLALLDQFASPRLAIAAYNAGPGAVERYNGIPPYRETQGHVRKVFSVFHNLTGQ